MSGAALAAALAIVVAAATIGFNTPSWSRSFTTATRFHAALAAHVVVYVVAFMIAFLLLQHVSRESAWPLVIALAIVLAVRAIPPLARLVREPLHRLARISEYAQLRGAALAESPIKASPAIAQSARTLLLSYRIDSSRDWLPPVQPLHERMQRTAELFVAICGWENERRFAGFIRETANELYRLRQRFDGLAFRVARTLSTIESLAELRHLACESSARDVAIDRRVKTMVDNLIADACEDVMLFHRDACMIATRGVLATELTSKGRACAIEALGFVKNEPEVLSVYRVFPYAAALLFAGLLVYFVMLPTPQPRAGGEPTLTTAERIVVILIIVMGAISFSIYTKLHFGFANGGLRQRTPWPFVLGAGLFAVMFAVLVNLDVGALLYGPLVGTWHGALIRVRQGVPYMPSAALTAGSIAWLIQDHRYRAIASARVRRACDAAIFSAVWIAGSAIAFALLRLAGTQRPSLVQMLAFSLVLGAAMGALIPELVRNPRIRGSDGTVMAPLSSGRFPILSAAAASTAPLPRVGA